MNEIKYLLAVFIQWTWRGGSAARREKARFFPSSRFVTIASLTWFRVIAYGIECWNRGCLDEQDFPPSISTSLERFEFFFFHLNLGAESSEISFRTKELFLWKSKGVFFLFFTTIPYYSDKSFGKQWVEMEIALVLVVENLADEEARTF